MFIDKKLWEKLKENIDNLYWDEDRMSSDGRYFLKQIDNNVKEIERKNVKEVFVVTNNAIVDDQIDYRIAGVCTSKENAKKLFSQTIKDVKCDSDFEEINPIKITDDIDLSKIDSEWCYEEDDYGFNLYLNGEYNSNNFSVQIERFKLDSILELDNRELV